MNKQEIPFISATELAGLIKAKEVSPVEAAEAYLDRIAAADGRLNSYITVTRRYSPGCRPPSGIGNRRRKLSGGRCTASRWR